MIGCDRCRAGTQPWRVATMPLAQWRGRSGSSDDSRGEASPSGFVAAVRQGPSRGQRFGTHLPRDNSRS
ncbi:hypothetical protein B5V03_17705 [Bradyrhizobium betae]|uniref:Uncharacterized protein n=1 Tax=Bradyrhizobium betae TaxID=244734 RepID=A0A4Q1V586_9BRAD|nr:hypothetical protein B5V03_17705 [Bradyrhizobium betae]